MYDKQYLLDLFNSEYDTLKLQKRLRVEEKEHFKLCHQSIEGENYEEIKNFINLKKLDAKSFFMSIYAFIMFKYTGGQEIIYTSFLDEENENLEERKPFLINFSNKILLSQIYEEIHQLRIYYENNKISFSEISSQVHLLELNNAFTFKKKEKSTVGIKGNINKDYFLVSETFNFDVFFNVMDSENRYDITLIYKDNYFDDYLMNNIVESYIKVTKVTDNYFTKNLDDIDYIEMGEKKKIIFDFNDNKYDYGHQQLCHVEFEKMAKAYPDNDVLLFEDQKFTYRTLNEMSNSLAYELRNYGVGKNEIVPIICERSYHLVVGALAVMKAGGGFLFIDDELPMDRIQYIIQEVQAKIVLEYLPKKGRLFKDEKDDVHILEYDLIKHPYEKHTENLSNINSSEDICCMFFTSGTTGKPKGILISHDNVINYCIYCNSIRNEKDFFTDAFSNVLAFTKVTYIIFISEIFYPLLRNKTTYLCNNEEYNNPSLIGKAIMKYSLDFIFSVSSRIKHYLKNEIFREAISKVRTFAFGGEPINYEFLENLTQYTKASIFYGYGLTETVVAGTVNYITPDDILQRVPLTIGKPVCNGEIYILDRALKPVPIGVVGEIYIGGSCVSHGYLHQEKLTQENFIPCPFSNTTGLSKKIYKTGDLGRWTEDGSILHLGRADFQIKILGQRVEISEIENTLKEIKTIDQVLILYKSKTKKIGQEKYLVCYYTTFKGETLSPEFLRNYLRKKLPIHMIPNYFMRIDQFPITAHGKLDRKSLPEPFIEEMLESHYVPPETDTEKKLCQFFSQILSIDKSKIGRDSNLFELGGNSLNTIKIIYSVQKELKVKLTMNDIFHHATIKALGYYIDNMFNHPQEQYEAIQIKKYNIKEFPITTQQLGIYIDSIKNTDSTIYNIPYAFPLKKGVTIEKIKKAFDKLLEQQTILRSKYYEKEVNGKINIYGSIEDNCHLNFESYTFENAKCFVRPFKLSQAPLIRVGFIGSEFLLLDMHHIISDGTSFLIIKEELNQFIENESILELEIKFSDYAIHLQEMKEKGLFDKQLEFYRTMFNEDYQLLNLPSKNEKISNTNTDGNGKEIELTTIKKCKCIQNIDNKTSKLIQNYVKINEISETAFFFDIYSFLLSKYSQQSMIYTSIMTANRNSHYVENMIGMMVTTLPLLIKYQVGEGEVTFLNHIKQTMNLLLEIYNNQDLSMSELMKELNLKKVNNSFIFQPKNIYDNYNDNNNNQSNSIFLDVNEEEFPLKEKFNRLTEELNHHITNPKFDLLFYVTRNQDYYSVEIEYNPVHYDSTLITRMLQSYVEIIKNIDDFNSPLQDLEYIPEIEKNKILNFNSDINDINSSCFYHQEFCHIAHEQPDQCAIVFNDIKLTYKELDELSNSLAHYIRKQGIMRNDIIPVISERSYFYIIATLAISKAGAAYLPVDNRLPVERIKFILGDVKPKIILYTNGTKKIINDLLLITKDSSNTLYFNIDNHDYNIDRNSIDNINEPDDTCYVLFTSGTTGQPKGVLISHSNMYSYLRKNDNDRISMYKIIKNNNIHNILAIANFSFDFIHNEVNLSLIHGLTIVLVDDLMNGDPSLLSHYILKHHVDLINITPSRCEHFMENKEFQFSLKNLKAIIFSGEEINLKLCKNIAKLSNCKIYNGYGLTECTVISTMIEVNLENNERLTIGKPIFNSKAYILDPHKNMVPIGVEGEIYIGGYGVGKGYLNRKELTQEKFIPCPFNENKNSNHLQKLYRTGDLGRWTENGEIEYFGRMDFQVKINGQRIELEEIMNTINEIKAIEKSFVILKKNEENKGYLVCYYLSTSDIQGKEIREYLKKKLPYHMIPNYYKRISEVPLSNSGKLNRKALPEPSIDDIVKEQYVPPKTEIEKKLCSIYGKLLPNSTIEEIGSKSDFYELGGDSLNSIKVLAMIEKEMNIKLNMKDIIEHPIVCDLGQYIEEFKNKNSTNQQTQSVVIKKRNAKEFPVSSQQLGVYIDSIKHLNSVIYNVSISIKLNKGVNIDKLQKAILKLFNEHEILKSKYDNKEINDHSEIYGYIDESCTLNFEYYTYENNNEFIRPFVLSKAPLMRVGFIENEVLLMDFHHIICDGMSVSIIIKELINNYNKDNNKNEECKIQYSDYAIDINEKKIKGSYNDQLKLFKNMFDEDYEVVNIPKINNNSINDKNNSQQNYNFGSYTEKIDLSIGQTINEFVKENRISKTTFFFTIYGYILSKYSGQNIIYSSIMNANRNDFYTNDLIGLMVNTLPILLNYEKCQNLTMMDTIKNISKNLISLYDHQALSLSELSNILKLKKVNNSFIYQPKTILNDDYENNSIFILDKNQKSESLFIDSTVNKNNVSKFDVIFSIIDNDDNDYSINIEYNVNLYNESIIKRIIHSYIEVLKNIGDYDQSQICEMNYIPKEEKEKILIEFNSNKYPLKGNNLYHVEFMKRVQEKPDQCAIVFNDIKLTYKELDELSNSLAHYIRKQGIMRNDIIPVISERSYFYIIATLAISKAGAAYLPVDNRLPAERIKFILDDVKPKIILYTNGTKKIINDLLLITKDSSNSLYFNIDNHDYNIDRNSIDNINEPDDTCYVLFTSGTTGQPKGVLISHSNMYSYLRKNDSDRISMYKIIKNNNIHNILAIANFSFDFIHNEVNLSLIHGLTIVLVDDLMNGDPSLLSHYILKHHVDLINITPSRCEHFMENKEFQFSLKNLKAIILAGEEINLKLCKNIAKLSNCKIYNGYGLTECTVISTMIEINLENNERLTIGKPIFNSKVYILDPYKNIVPIGVEGEIYIGGYGVGKGYLNRKELTQEKFIPCPFNENKNSNHLQKLYRTGDLGRWTENGEIEYFGRMDFQVKINGQRIELEEIMNTINEIKAIEHSFVILKKNEENKGYLVCYYLSTSDIQGKEIREYLKKKLPYHMIPNYYKRISEVPLSNSGKLNRKALPEPSIDDIVKEQYVPPKTEIEKKLCSIYGKLLPNSTIEEIGSKSDFYELGGDSLNSIKVLAMIEKEMNIKLNMKDIIEHPIVCDLGQYIEEFKNKNSTNQQTQSVVIKKRNAKEFPVSSQQLGVYIDSIKHLNSVIYNVPISIKLNKGVNIDKLQKAILKLFNEHEILKSKYDNKEINDHSEIYGYIDESCTLNFEYYTYENNNEFIRPFVLSKAPLMRVGFIENEVLLMDFHHIICDGMSVSIIIKELINNYNKDNNKNEECKIQYSDYAIDINEKKIKGSYNDQLKLFKNMFDEDYEVVNIPKINNNSINDKNNSQQNYNFGSYTEKIDLSIGQTINKFVKENRISKTTFFFTIYGYILSKYSGQNIIYSSIMNANRNDYYTNDLIGLMVNTLPILLNYENCQNLTMMDTIKNISKNLISLYDHQALSLSELSNILKLKKVNNSFIYQPKTILNDDYENNSIFILDKNQKSESLFIDSTVNKNNVSKFDVIFSIIDNDDNDYSINIEYNVNLYNESIIKRIIHSYIEVLKNIGDYDQSQICEMNYIPKEEKEKILIEFNSNKYPLKGNNLYHVEFMKRVQEKPDQCAIVFNDIKLTYKELDELSNSLAHYIRKQGIMRNDIIPVISERSYFYIIATLAISKAGAAYLPVDNRLPIERIKFILDDVHSKIILYYQSENIINILMKNDEYKNRLYNIQQHNYNFNKNYIENINEPEDTCYVLFTSGTTGRPKGGIVSHFNIYNFIRSFPDDQDYLSLSNLLLKKNSVQNILSIANFPFDLYHIEVTFSLIHGLKVILTDDVLSEDIYLLSKYIIKNKIELITTTPTRFKIFMENDEFRNAMKLLKVVIFIGEALSYDLCDKVHQFSSCKIYNSYGPTECAVTCTIKEINVKDCDQNIKIGRPLCNCQLYVLDKYLKPVPIGVDGEIVIGGYGVGKGYHNREKLTKEKYLPSPFNTNENDQNNNIIYRTGDLGRWNEKGEIEYLGRMDFQVKINGHRVELGEIECVINEITNIKHSAVINKANKNGDNYLVGYYVLEKNTEPSMVNGRIIREFLKKKLPKYMIPNYFICIDHLPMNRNGKLNREALPKPNINNLISDQYIPPETEVEKLICKIYSRVFNVNETKIGKMSDFVELGGNSLNAIRISSIIEKELKIKLFIKDIINHPQVSDFAEYIEELLNSNSFNRSMSIIEKRNKKEFIITPQQLGVYFDSIKNPDSIIYNMPVAIKLNPSIDIEKIKKAFITIFNTHEILKSKYEPKEINGKSEICGFIDEECQLKFENYTYENIKTFVRPFDLSKAPLLRIGFVRDEILLIDMHHMISDGASMAIITKELSNYYNGKAIEQLDIQFSDYAIDFNEKKNMCYYDNQYKFYENMFQSDYEQLNIPKKDNDNDTLSDQETKDEEVNVKTCHQTLGKTLTESIHEYIKINNISETAFFFTIYGYVLSKYSGQEVIYSSIMSANRNYSSTENMIGMLVSTQPILLRYDNEEKSFLDVIKDHSKILMELYNNQDISFSELHKSLNLLNMNNSFIFQPKERLEDPSNQPIFSKKDNEFIYSIYEFQNTLNNNKNVPKFSIKVNVIEMDEDYSILLDYDTNLYDYKMMNSLLQSYIEVLHNINQFNKNVHKIDYIPEKERERILKEFNNNEYEYEMNQLYHVEFKKVAEKYPNKCAILCGSVSLTYQMLENMSNSLAYYLREQKVGRGDIIPIITERSHYFVVAALAIMKAGGAYLPIDPNFPHERIDYMINEVNPKIILTCLTDQELEKQMNFGNFIIYSLLHHNYTKDTTAIKNINESDDICYVLFTSGTTGKPKGTLITHNNLINYCVYSQTYNGKVDMYGEGFDNILSITKFTHDISVGEINYPLLRGCKIVLCNDEEYNDPEILAQIIRNQEIRFIFTVPSRFENYMNNENFAKSIKDVKWILLGGERLDNKTILSIYDNSSTKVLSVYGLTETSVVSNIKILDRDEQYNKNRNLLVPIGKPTCNFKMYILDRYMKPVPVGIPGDVYIAGIGVGKGYLNREDLTSEKFMDCPFETILGPDHQPCKMYLTGDLGKWNDRGEIVCLGRQDFQVKIRGQRIELGEIESTINEIDGIDHSIVIDKVKKETNEKYLMCYFLSSREVSGKEIRNYLKTKLAAYMIPNYYKRIYEIPLSASGKLNRKELPELTNDDLIKENYLPPESEIEKKICEIYCNIFNMKEKVIGKTSNFYDLGGDSLIAIRAISQLSKTLQIKIRIKDIMNNPTVEKLALFVEEMKKKNNEVKENEVKNIMKYNNQEYPITSILSSLVFNANNNITFDKFRKYSNNMIQYYKLETEIDIKKLTNAINMIINRHSVLKSIFYEKEISSNKKEIYGKVREKVDFKIEEYTSDNFHEFIRPFDITHDLLIRVGIIENSILMIDMDHRIADGYSFGILIKELFTIYTNETLPELLIQYTDYAIDYDKRLKSGNINNKINFYKSIFNNIPQEEMNLSLKFKENENKLQENNGYKLITVDTDSEVFDIINKIAKEHNLSKTAIFLTVYSLVLSLYSGKKNIFNAVISSSRMNKDTEGMIGLFARYIPTLVKFDQQSSLIETIKTCMDTLLTMFNDDIPFTMISEELNLPTCQSWFKFDPYTMMNNDTISFGKSVTCNEVYDQFNCEYLKPNNEIPSLNALDYLTLENSPDFIYTISEKKDHYTIEFLYKNEKYKECFIQEIIFNFIAIIKNVENFNVDLSSKDITLKANLIKYYDYDNQKIDENSNKITNTTIKNDINNNNNKLVLDNFHNNNATKNINNQGTNELNNTKSLNYDKNKNINKNNNKFQKFIKKFQKIFM